MKRTTHLVLGAAAGTLVAASASLPVATGALWLGIAGGGFPDWLDLRSELRRPLRLRHRGASHGVPFALAMTVVLGAALRALVDGSLDGAGRLAISRETADVWTVAFAAGLVTHLLADACTTAGIRPLLPLSGWTCWLLPRLVRSRSDGYLNVVALGAGMAVIGFVVIGRIASGIGVV